MTEPISDPEYWRQRYLASLNGDQHHAIFKCDKRRWERIEAAHREILARSVGTSESVLDAGCAWGRLLHLLPPRWNGRYVGVDLAPVFIEAAKAQQRLGQREFHVGDLRDLSFLGDQLFDWTVLISIRPMVRRNLGDEEWTKMETELRKHARRLLYLEYDETDGGEQVDVYHSVE